MNISISKYRYISKLVNSLLDLIYPPVCPITNMELKDGESIISDSIFYKFDIAGNPINIKNKKIDDYVENDFYFEDIYSLFSNFHESQELIHLIKYKKYFWVGENIGKKLGEKILKETKISYDYIIPVPLHKVKKRSRGFNQAFYIAQGINSALKSEVKEEFISRAKYTITQTKLKSKDRKENLKEVFLVNLKYSDLLKGKNILIVDDVITTGSTINSIAKELSKYNPNRIDCATITLA
jgi:ComF family protein